MDTEKEGEANYIFVVASHSSEYSPQRAPHERLMECAPVGFPITAIREIKILSTLKDENVVNLREIVRSDSEYEICLLLPIPIPNPMEKSFIRNLNILSLFWHLVCKEGRNNTWTFCNCIALLSD